MNRRAFLLGSAAAVGAQGAEPWVRRAYSFLWARPERTVLRSGPTSALWLRPLRDYEVRQLHEYLHRLYWSAGGELRARSA